MLPNYQKIMLPFLKILKDGKEYSIKDLTKILEKNFNLTEEERSILKDNGVVTIFSARVGWVRTCLIKAGLIEFPEIRKSKITSLGKKILEENLLEIDNKYLLKFDTFREFYLKKDDLNSETENHCEETPEENMSKSYDVIKEALMSELLDRILKMSSEFFEKLVVELLLKMGYGYSGKVVGGRNDGGIDGVIYQDKLELDYTYIQAKCWRKDHRINSGEIDKFRGALTRQGVKKGVYITTCDFTPDAIMRAKDCTEYKIALIDGERLANLMIEHDLGCVSYQSYNLKKVYDEYFDE